MPDIYIMDSLYCAWAETCNKIVDNNLQQWKSEKDVYYMLEHVPGEYANVYLDLILGTGLSMATVQDYTILVDSTGGAQTQRFMRQNKIINSSTTCLRYLSHALDIVGMLSKIDKDPISVVEIGGGYGGLAVAINYVLKIKQFTRKIDYTIIDLTAPQRLQKYYTDRFNLDFISLDFIDSQLYGNDINKTNIFVVSNYSLGEMGEENRNKYIDAFISKKDIIGGYIQWNSGASTDFLQKFQCNIVEEHPKTGPDNKTVRFYNL